MPEFMGWWNVDGGDHWGVEDGLWWLVDGL
jgi:hypothetical protein